MRRYLILPLMLLLLAGCSNGPEQNTLEAILADGELRVLTRNTATTYYEGATGPVGVEYELAKGFADYLGVELKLIVASNVSEILSQLAEGEAHLAAAGLTITEPRQMWLRFTPAYQFITPQLVYRAGQVRPRSLLDLTGTLEVAAESSHAERLHLLRSEFPDLVWHESAELDSEELLARVYEGEIDYTVVDSNEMAVNRRYFPELRVAINIAEPEPLAWAFPKYQDDALYEKAVAYFHELDQSGRLSQLLERYYGHIGDFDYVGTRTFMRHIESRLPEYRKLFEYAGQEYGIDWRLLAAMAYQESHWDPNAVSPTGVKGIMMLTQVTADYIGVEERTDPAQSIMGGAAYFERLLNKIPPRIAEPDRLWLALAAYNIGFAHLEDGRILTQRRGGNPDLWKDLKANLPLLRQRKWHSQTRHGYARGNEAVTYVDNIRSYYDVLIWVTEREHWGRHWLLSDSH